MKIGINKKTVLSLIASLLLIGCGGGSNNSSTTSSTGGSVSTTTSGSGGSGSTTPAAKSAVFEDSKVINLDYVTSSGNIGSTDNDGKFYYYPNDKNITFKIGDLIVGSISTSNIKNDIVLPNDLLGIDRNDTTNENLIKILIFLQSLDKDHNVSNGIEITNDIKDKISTIVDNNSSISKNLTDNNLTVLQNIIQNIGLKSLDKKSARIHYMGTLFSLGIHAQQFPFISIWEVTGSDLTIKIPINPNVDEEYNFTVDWGDGNISKEVNSSISHEYATEGNYTVKITGIFPAIYINARDVAPNTKLKQIIQWGDIEWKSFRNAFKGCKYLEINASDVPFLENVTNMSNSFNSVKTNVFKNIDKWDVSHVIDMSYMFYESDFNTSINDWNVSSVKYMNWMFAASKFNQPLDKWDVSHVIDMSYMFSNTSFNQNINDWNVSSVKYMDNIFNGASNFNQPLDKWNVNHVVSMGSMFAWATSFNQNINDWNVSSVTNMNNMFYRAKNFNQPLDKWDVSNVTNMGDMFHYATSFDQNISDWNVSNVTQCGNFDADCPIHGTSKEPHFTKCTP